MLVCFVFIYFFKLNLPATQLANVLMTVPELFCLIPFIRGGEVIYGFDPLPLDFESLKTQLKGDWMGALAGLSGRLIPAITAWAVFALVATPLIILLLKPILQRVMNK